MLNSMQSNEIKNWTKISSYGPLFHLVTGIVLLLTFIIGIVLVPLLMIRLSDLNYNLVLTAFIITPLWIAFMVPAFLLSKSYGSSTGEIVLFEEGFKYSYRGNIFVAPWEDVEKIELKKEVPKDSFNKFLGFFLNKETHEVQPRLVTRIYTKNNKTEAINGYLSGNYFMPQEIQTTDLSVEKIDIMNEHCANMLYCIARRAINADWTGELSGINKLGWDIKIPETNLL